MDAILFSVMDLCKRHGKLLRTDLDGTALLASIAFVESSGGKNNYPNFEPYWAPEGKVFTIEGKLQRSRHPLSNKLVVERFNEYGMASACSFSSWQILYHTAADLGFKKAPWLLWEDAIAILWVIKRLNVLVGHGAETIEHFADAWNSGSFRDRIIPKEYIEKVSDVYTKLTT